MRAHKIRICLMIAVTLEQVALQQTFAVESGGSRLSAVAESCQGSDRGQAAPGNEVIDPEACLKELQYRYLFQGAEGAGAQGKHLQWKVCPEEVTAGGAPAPGNAGVASQRTGDLATVRIPVAVWLVGTGIVGLVGIRRRRQKSSGTVPSRIRRSHG